MLADLSYKSMIVTVVRVVLCMNYVMWRWGKFSNLAVLDILMVVKYCVVVTSNPPPVSDISASSYSADGSGAHLKGFQRNELRGVFRLCSWLRLAHCRL